MQRFKIIVAMDYHSGIGKEGRLPWNAPAEMQHFTLTTRMTADPGKMNALVMGRKTWAGMGKRSLPGRITYVLTRGDDARKQEIEASGCRAAGSLPEALADCTWRRTEIEEVFVCGGREVYAEALAMPNCEKLIISRVQGEFSCDSFFPEARHGSFRLERTFGPISKPDQPEFEVEHWTRREPETRGRGWYPTTQGYTCSP